MKVSIKVNGAVYEHDIEPRMLLVHFIRDVLGLTGTKVGCDTSQCGACTVHLDGKALKSCTYLAAQADGKAITTIEALADGQDYHVMQQSFWEKHGLQCGFCTPGMIMAMSAFIKEQPAPSEPEIRHNLEGNMCRCTGYQNIVAAVKAATESAAGGD